MRNEAQCVTERINDFVVIDQSVANQMIKAYNEAYEVKSLDWFLGGKSTSNYKVCVKNLERPMVLRVYPSTHVSGGKELSLSRSMKGIIPIPEIYYYNDEKTIIPFDFALVAYVEGTPLDQLGGPTDGIAYQLGEILACIHRFEYPKEGLLDDSLNLMAGLPPIQAWYDYFLNGRAGNRLKASTKNQLLAFGESYRLIMTEICERFMLSHGDFRPANILIHEDRVVGIMDWEFALSAPCYFILGSLCAILPWFPLQLNSVLLKDTINLLNTQLESVHCSYQKRWTS